VQLAHLKGTGQGDHIALCCKHLQGHDGFAGLTRSALSFLILQISTPSILVTCKKLGIACAARRMRFMVGRRFPSARAKAFQAVRAGGSREKRSANAGHPTQETSRRKKPRKRRTRARIREGMKTEHDCQTRLFDACSARWYKNQYFISVGPWRSWERASMASRRPWVRIPSAPPNSALMGTRWVRKSSTRSKVEIRIFRTVFQPNQRRKERGTFLLDTL
jgi:hypothetical protein